MDLEKIKSAMLCLEQMPCSGIIGIEGPTQTDLDNAVRVNGMSMYGDSVFHQTQQTWIYLNDFLNDIDNTAQQRIEFSNDDEPQKESLIDIIYNSQNEVDSFFAKRKERIEHETCQQY
jgi:hypothetical protein